MEPANHQKRTESKVMNPRIVRFLKILERFLGFQFYLQVFVEYQASKHLIYLLDLWYFHIQQKKQHYQRSSSKFYYRINWKNTSFSWIFSDTIGYECTKNKQILMEWKWKKNNKHFSSCSWENRLARWHTKHNSLIHNHFSIRT